MVNHKRIYTFLLSLPLLATTTSYILSPQQTSTQNLSNTSSVMIKSQDVSANVNVTNSDASTFLLNLSSGDRSIYERKATWGAIEWGDKVIPIYGNISRIASNDSNRADKIVLIQALQGNDLIYEKFIKTDKDGKFTAFFYPPQDGTVKVIAQIIGQNSTAKGAITVVATQAWMPAILITIFMTAAIVCIFIFYFWYIKSNTVAANRNKAILRAGLIPVFVLTVFSYIILYKFPPFDAAGNGVIATALIGPIAAYVFEALKES